MHPQEFPEHCRVAAGALRALLVEPDAERADQIAAYLERQHVSVRREARGDAAFAALGEQAPGIVIMAASAPGLNAQDFCRRLRGEGSALPLLVTTDRVDLFDHIVCLELGADDYVASDIPPRLLWARVKSLLRRSSAQPAVPPHGEIASGDLVLDRRALEARLHGVPVKLTLHEFHCVWALAEQAGSVVSREEISRTVNERCGGDPIRGRSVDTQISRLRRKLETVDPNFHRIRSVRARGYMFCPSRA